MKFLKYMSLLAAGGLIYLLYNALRVETSRNLSRQEKITSPAKPNKPAPESYPLIYDVITTLIPALKY